MLRLTPQDLPHGQRPAALAPPDPAAAERLLPALAADLHNYQRQLRQRLQAPLHDDPPDPAAALVLAYLERYGEGLCGHPVVRDPSGRAVAVVARTNNILEHYFATSKQGLRRRLRRAHLGRDLADQPAQAALAANLLDPDYVRIVCGSLDQLPRAFAALESPAASHPPRLQRNNRDAALRRRNRAWADDTTQTPASITSTAHPNAPSITAF